MKRVSIGKDELTPHVEASPKGQRAIWMVHDDAFAALDGDANTVLVVRPDARGKWSTVCDVECIELAVACQGHHVCHIGSSLEISDDMRGCVDLLVFLVNGLLDPFKQMGRQGEMRVQTCKKVETDCKQAAHAKLPIVVLINSRVHGVASCDLNVVDCEC